jgi:hypothetical protein
MIASSTREREVKELLGDLAQTDFPKSANLKRALACLADLRRYGLERLTIWEVVEILRLNRVRTIGYKEYLYEILGPWANHPTGQCWLWRNGEEIEVQSSYWKSQPLVEYLAFLESQVGLENAPDRIEFTDDGSKLVRHI